MVLGLMCSLDDIGEVGPGDLCSMFVERVKKGPINAEFPMVVIGPGDEVMCEVGLSFQMLSCSLKLTIVLFRRDLPS